ncbi:ATP-dependent DNA helicase [Apilactobacillus apisilvae]|uniref:ATP-dependent DNA helicase n=1 Tax=Apilactobacillus apisilvae TaxID=2923364 RepID=A0ABY4PF37_9LACO|nr:ATP-dependent DNA helicase [Apilactobacillus apisilvae]UQS84423.1 ATP-dependent DNA helicase [Apilactobacillus apisilvae]
MIIINHIGVRELVEFTLRSGDLNSHLNSNNTAKQGTRIHRKLQKKQSKDYQSEINLSKKLVINNIQFKLDGRIDGLISNDKKTEIEEIKTSDLNFNEIPDNILKLYWGQAKVYAHLLMDAKPKIKKVTLKLTYVQTPDEKINTKYLDISKKEAKTFFDNLINEYEEWLKLRSDIIKKRNVTAKKLKFPFKSFRKGQREFAATVYKSIAFQKHLFAQAPTGTGKTISTLFPAVKAMGENLCNRIFYFTAKQSTQSVAEETLNILSQNKLYIKSITITAKDKIIFDEERNVKPEDNKYMIGYYDRLKPAIKQILTNENQINNKVLKKYAKQYQLDPFEFSLDISLFCDVIICDYNYLFDPQVYLKRFFAVKDSDNIFLIDEAHNLVNRSRDMYSASLNNSPIKKLIKLSNVNTNKNEKLNNALKTFNRSYKSNTKILKDKNVDQVNFSEPLNAFNKQVNKLIDKIHEWLRKNEQDDELTDMILEYYFKLLHYQRINDFYDQTYQTRIFKDNQNTIIKLFCIDPSQNLSESLSLGGAAVLFSATLSPIKYYQRLLGDEDDSLSYEIESPFKPTNQQIIINNYIATTYKQRANNVQKIIDSIKTMVNNKFGHYLIFAPSKHFLEMIVKEFKKQNPNIPIIEQESFMNNDQRANFINTFKNNTNKNLIGFALLGGIFSEGIDLKHDELIGVGIISVGLPGLSTENNLIKEFFDKENGHGFEYAYQLPGLNNIFQAAGRLIRTDQDVGNILLMDYRFSQSRYKKYFPNNWQKNNLQTAYSQKQNNYLIKNFWQMHKK